MEQSLTAIPHLSPASPSPPPPQFLATLEGKLPLYNTRILLPVASVKDKFFGQCGPKGDEWEGREVALSQGQGGGAWCGEGWEGKKKRSLTLPITHPCLSL